MGKRQLLPAVREPGAAPGAEAEIVSVIQKLAELVRNKHKEDSPEVQELLGELYRLKQMYPIEFSDIITTRADLLQTIYYAFLEIHNKK